MSSLDALHKRIDRMLAQERERQLATTARETHRVVIYDPETGEPLPGFAPHPGSGIHVYIPDNGRDNYSQVWLPRKDEQ